MLPPHGETNTEQLGRKRHGCGESRGEAGGAVARTFSCQPPPQVRGTLSSAPKATALSEPSQAGNDGYSGSGAAGATSGSPLVGYNGCVASAVRHLASLRHGTLMPTRANPSAAIPAVAKPQPAAAAALSSTPATATAPISIPPLFIAHVSRSYFVHYIPAAPMCSQSPRRHSRSRRFSHGRGIPRCGRSLYCRTIVGGPPFPLHCPPSPPLYWIRPCCLLAT
jgi:hypothetical protein